MRAGFSLETDGRVVCQDAVREEEKGEETVHPATADPLGDLQVRAGTTDSDLRCDDAERRCSV